MLQLTAYEDQLKLLEKKFVVISILFQKYEKVFDQLVGTPPDPAVYVTAPFFPLLSR